MPVTDPIADMLTRIRNAQAVHHETVLVPHSKLKAALLGLMRSEGFIASFQPVERSNVRMLKVGLRYYADDTPAIHGLKRVSRPGLRIYSKSQETPRYFGKLGVVFISTPQGLMTGTQARKRRLGGELLFYIW